MLLNIFKIFSITELDIAFIQTKLLNCMSQDMSTKLFQSYSFTNSVLLASKIFYYVDLWNKNNITVKAKVIS